ncbi:unnamed protein product [Blepharisma stoltei]|uniref:Uncharacterized protein n=1 Tax=Blepharisma stoltei TaxID=1481888 RepID=A0AAU9J9D5_9CILI|nr:unnamed protein product [Blepharisma stoltei]
MIALIASCLYSIWHVRWLAPSLEFIWEKIHYLINAGAGEKMFYAKRRHNNPLISRCRHQYAESVCSGKQRNIEMEEGQAITSDTSFYDKCKAYLNVEDPERYNYYEFKALIERRINRRGDFDYEIGSIFRTNADCYEIPDEEDNLLTNITAAIYMILKEKEIYLGIDDLKNTVYTYLSEAAGVERSEDIWIFLENYNL